MPTQPGRRQRQRAQKVKESQEALRDFQEATQLNPDDGPGYMTPAKNKNLTLEEAKTELVLSVAMLINTISLTAAKIIAAQLEGDGD